jgi:signal transduction histidine kinase
MRRFAADIFSAKGIAFQFNTSEKDSGKIVNSNLRRETFLIFKELISNVVKHSGARKVSISLDVSGTNLRLEIKDDGHGFDSSGIDPREATDSQFARINPASKGGNGLRNMFRRAAEMNGHIFIDSSPGRGTTTFLMLPLEPATHTGGEVSDEIV